MHFSDLGVFLGRCEFAKVDYYTKDPVKHQERILKGIMEKNKDTEYGKKIGFRMFIQQKISRESYPFQITILMTNILNV